MKNQVAIKPLYDDVSMKKKTLFQRIVIKLIGDIYLSRSLKKQLAMRPETWGLGLWPDEETKRVAIICAEHLSANYGCGSAGEIFAFGMILNIMNSILTVCPLVLAALCEILLEG